MKKIRYKIIQDILNYINLYIIFKTRWKQTMLKHNQEWLSRISRGDICHPTDCQGCLGWSGWLGGCPCLPSPVGMVLPEASGPGEEDDHSQRGRCFLCHGCRSSCSPLLESPNKPSRLTYSCIFPYRFIPKWTLKK